MQKKSSAGTCVSGQTSFLSLHILLDLLHRQEKGGAISFVCFLFLFVIYSSTIYLCKILVETQGIVMPQRC